MRKTILSSAGGAKFVRGDLHIHSFGGSYDVRDSGMTPEGIVTAGMRLGLSILAITDHNSTANIGRFLVAAASHHDLLAIPGVELSCSEGHLLCYLKDERVLNAFFLGLSISSPDPKTGETHCNTSLGDCLTRLEQYGGFGLLAHVDGDAGLERRIPTMTPQKVDILCHPALLGFEVSVWPNEVYYSERDKDQARNSIGKKRSEKLGGTSFGNFATVLSSDAHTTAALGRNQGGKDRTTRYKLQEPTFDALRIALLDPSARVRIEDDLGPATARLTGIGIEGGFLDGFVIRFSPNLTCLIGGRGAGKTTALSCAEIIRAIDLEVDEDSLLESDIGPTRLMVLAEDEHGAEYVIEKAKSGRPVAMDSKGNTVMPALRVDVFRQAEAPQLAQKVKENQGALLDHLDLRIPEVAVCLAEDERLREQHASLCGELSKAEEQVELLEQAVKSRTGAEAQLSAATKAEVSALADLEKRRSLANSSKELLHDVKEQLDAAFNEDRVGSILSAYEESLRDVDAARTLPGGGHVDGTAPTPTLIETLRSIAQKVRDVQATVKSEADALLNSRGAEFAGLSTALRASIDAKKKELRDAGIPFDAEVLQRLSRQVSELPGKRSALVQAKKALQAVSKSKLDCERARRDLLGRIHTLRTAWAVRVLRNVPKSDLAISLKYHEGRCSPLMEALIVDAMRWRTNQVPRARAIVTQLGALGLTDAIDKKDPKPLLFIKAPNGEPMFAAQEAQMIIGRLFESRDTLFRTEIGDLPQLVVSRTDGKYREFSKLSVGQQQSVLLALMLADDAATGPLLLDQPEDNLDGEFVFKTVVPALRSAKERRQIILVTHNPNICVLGDAEQIIVLKSAAEKSSAIAVGSIDAEDVRKRVCEVLEGTEEAFKLRAKMYRIST